MKSAVLVIGGGIAGMRAAAELLQQRFKVYLLEEGTCISGKTEVIERLFPPEEHAACALQPLMIELTNNPNSTILTSSKLSSFEGEPGNFRVQILTENAGIRDSTKNRELTIGALIIAGGPDTEISESLGKLGLELDEKGYVKKNSQSQHPCCTCRDGVFICGATQEPKEISELVISACAAVANVAALLTPFRGSE